MPYELKSVLSIAGSDSSGGAGIQADIKTVEALGLFAQTAITALTAQNTTGVFGVLEIPPSFVRSQIDVVFDDIRPDAVKIGMVPSAECVYAIAEGLRAHGASNVVIDPVMVSTSGSSLMGEGVKDIVMRELLPLASIVTPNIPEAEALTGREVRGKADMEAAARLIASMTPGAVLVKGGHGIGSGDCDDLLFCEGVPIWISGTRIDTPNTHGTGCTLSSAIACGLASGTGVRDAVVAGKAYVTEALSAGLDLGSGSGPLDHMWRMR